VSGCLGPGHERDRGARLRHGPLANDRSKGAPLGRREVRGRGQHETAVGARGDALAVRGGQGRRAERALAAHVCEGRLFITNVANLLVLLGNSHVHLRALLCSA
jgi:hypothetical protein